MAENHGESILVLHLPSCVRVSKVTAHSLPPAGGLGCSLGVGGYQVSSNKSTNDSFWRWLLLGRTCHGLFLLSYVESCVPAFPESALHFSNPRTTSSICGFDHDFDWVSLGIYDTLCYLTSQCSASNIFVYFDIYFPLGGYFENGIAEPERIWTDLSIEWETIFLKNYPFSMLLAIYLLPNDLLLLQCIIFVYFC